jgi:L-gulonolactone oxidase
MVVSPSIARSSTAATRRRKNTKQSLNGRLVKAQPKSAEDLARVLTDAKEFPSPLRPVGSGSSVTRCSETATGTLVDMSRLNRVLGVKGDTVTVQAGCRLRDLAEHLAHDNMELVGGCTDSNRTVGGAISSGSMGARLPGDGAQFASSVCHITLINVEGRRVEIGEKLPDLLRLVRMSYGLFGIIYSIQLKIRPIQLYSISNSKIDVDEFVRLIPNLMEARAAVSASIMPFRDRVHIELRYPDEGERKSRALPWKLRDWATHSALPKAVRSVSKAIPLKNIRDPLIETMTEATHALSRLTDSGSNAAEQTGRFKRLVLDEKTSSCAWLFPVDQVAAAVPAYIKFCQGHYRSAGFRCDLPADIWRVNQDQGALLSPSFDGPGFVFNMRSSQEDGWDDYLLEFAEFAAHFKGVPIFNLTKGFKPGYANRMYGDRLKRFTEMRNRLDPKNRLLNQFFAEHVR